MRYYIVYHYPDCLRYFHEDIRYVTRTRSNARVFSDHFEAKFLIDQTKNSHARVISDDEADVLETLRQ